MLNTIIRKYNKNRKRIWTWIIIIGFAIGIKYALNTHIRNNNKIGSGNNATIYFTNKDKNDYPIMSEQKEQNKSISYNLPEVSKAVKTFIDYCNNREIEKAYNMLSEDTKHYLYKTQADFINNYYNIYYKTKKTYNIQAWITENNYYIYKINLQEDLLSTGNVNSKKVEEYYTVKKENRSL